MELRIWRFGTDDVYIKAWLESQSLAHGFQQLQTLDWFHWKFEQSPYGKAILACAFDGDIVAGCVAYGMGKMKYHGQEYRCALSYETFVRPDYQGHGLFKKLIDLAEEEAKRQAIPFLYNFPNSNSLTGFRHMGWVWKNDAEQLRIRVLKPFKLLRYLKDLRTSFMPSESNLSTLKSIRLDDVPIGSQENETVTPIWTKEYLKWRFFTYPNREYHVINNGDLFAISMVGYRGKIKDAHILYAVSKNDSIPITKMMPEVIKILKKDVAPIIISYSDSIGDKTLTSSWGFVKVPSHSNFCYKILDDSLKIERFCISLPGINAHTY